MYFELIVTKSTLMDLKHKKHQCSALVVYLRDSWYSTSLIFRRYHQWRLWQREFVFLYTYYTYVLHFAKRKKEGQPEETSSILATVAGTSVLRLNAVADREGRRNIVLHLRKTQDYSSFRARWNEMTSRTEGNVGENSRPILY